MTNVINKIISKSKWNIKCPYSMKPEFIVIHNTANDASAASEVSYMGNNNQSTSYHFAVDDKEAIQALPLNRNAWHAGDGAKGAGNRKGIAIEICYSKSGGTKFDKAEDNAAQLVAELLKEYNWGIDKVKKHQDFSGKYCPHRTLDLGWERFIEKVKKYMNKELTETEEIVNELYNRQILTAKEYWLNRAKEDNNIYWLMRKTANYVRSN